MLKKVVEKFGIPQLMHSLEMLLCPNISYMEWFICWQLMWYHCSQLSQETASVFNVTARLHVPQGYFGVRGPGFGSGAYEFVSSRLHRYISTNLSYFINDFLDCTI